MKINGSTDLAGTLAATGAKTTGKAGGTKEADQTADSAPVRLSDLSARLHALESGSSVEADFDANKVETIKQAIRDGKFTVNAEMIADRLIADARDLMKPRVS